MSLRQVLFVLLVGFIAGWLASLVMKVKGLGLFGYTVIGIVGAAVGSWTMGMLGVSLGDDLLHEVASAFIGALLVLALVSLLKK